MSVDDVPVVGGGDRRHRRADSVVPVGVLVGAVGAVVVVAMAGLFVIRGQRGLSFGELTRDPAAVSNTLPYVGYLSSIGIVAWTTGGAVPLFTWAVLRPVAAHPMLLAFGLLTAYLCLDDLFLLHEVVLPYELGIPERLDELVIAVAAGAFVARFRRSITATGAATMLAAALACLGASALLDLVEPWGETDNATFIEDSLKFIGIIAWTCFGLAASWVGARSRLLGPR